MKTLFLLLVLMAALIVPSQSQGGYNVSASETMVTAVYKSKVSPLFKDEATSPICINQTIQRPNRSIINYWISIKNTGETELTNVTLKVTPPTNFTHRGSYYFYPTKGDVPLLELLSNKDGTTKNLLLDPGNLNTGGLKTIIVTFELKGPDDRANDQKNAVEVRATALNPSDKVQFEETARDISNISATCIDTIDNGEITTYEILVTNFGKTRLTDVFLNATLPESVEYIGSMYNNSKDERTLPKPTELRNPDGTTNYLSWFLDYLETNSSKSIYVYVSCRSNNSCSNLSDEQVKASGWTSIVNKIPIKVTSGEYQETVDTIVEAEEPVIAPEENDSVSTPGEIIA